MSVFALAAIFSLGVGPLFAGWIEMDPNLGWKWINWVQMTWVLSHSVNSTGHHFNNLVFFLQTTNRWSGAFVLLTYFFLEETRSTIVLEKVVKQMRKKTGDQRYRAHVEKPKLLDLIRISCTRPLRECVRRTLCIPCDLLTLFLPKVWCWLSRLLRVLASVPSTRGASL